MSGVLAAREKPLIKMSHASDLWPVPDQVTTSDSSKVLPLGACGGERTDCCVTWSCFPAPLGTGLGEAA